jgi:hypothetical protein
MGAASHGTAVEHNEVANTPTCDSASLPQSNQGRVLWSIGYKLPRLQCSNGLQHPPLVLRLHLTTIRTAAHKGRGFVLGHDK